jgi:hypothetical protein
MGVFRGTFVRSKTESYSSELLYDKVIQKTTLTLYFTASFQLVSQKTLIVDFDVGRQKMVI